MTEHASVDHSKAIVDPAPIQAPPSADWTPTCLGDWCGRRESCWYHVGPQRLRLSERICPRGDTRHFRAIPIQQEQT